MRLVSLLLLAACSGSDTTDETGISIDDLCEGAGEASVQMGFGVGGAFDPLEAGTAVGLDIAPQGGFGVTVQVRTTGLQTDAGVDVLLETELDGAPSGSFLNDTTQLFCMDDGTGVVGSGVAVGFDPDVWTTDNLTELNGREADLIVTVTDQRGIRASARQTVVIQVGQ